MNQEKLIKQLSAENERLKLAIEELSILNEVSTAVSSTSALNVIVDLIVQKCVKHLKVEQGAVLLFDKLEHGSALKTMVRKVETDVTVMPLRLSEQINGWMLKNQRPLVVNDFTTEQRFLMPTVPDGIRSLLCVPLKLQGRLIGILNVFNKRNGAGFTAGDQRLLSIISTQSAQIVENARLAEEEKQFELLQKELHLARDIQQNLLPKQPPCVEGYEISGRSEPALRVGGDYFDFLQIAENRLGICLADVSGKGITAALLMSNVQATIRGQSRLAGDAERCVANSNDMLHASTDSDKFVTMFYGVLDTSTHCLEYCNAGHNPPLLLNGTNKPVLLETGGPVLGVLPGYDYQRGQVELLRGQTLLVYSDGFSEAMNRGFEEYGEDRLRQVAIRNTSSSPEQLLETIVQDVSSFCGDAPQADDMTILAVRRQPD